MQTREINRAVLNTGSFGAISGIIASIAGAIFVYFVSIINIFPVVLAELLPPYEMVVQHPGAFWLISPDVLTENFLRWTAPVGAALIVSMILLSIGMYGLCVENNKRKLGIIILIIGILAAIISTSALFLSIIAPSYQLAYKTLFGFYPVPLTPFLTLVIQVGANTELFLIAFFSLGAAFLLFGPILMISRHIANYPSLTMTSGVISLITGAFFLITAFPYTRLMFGPTAFILMSVVSILLIIVFFTTGRR